MTYFDKMRGGGDKAPPSEFRDIAWSWGGSFLGIALVACLHQYVLAPEDLVLVIGSFGASAVLVYGAIDSPLAQPRNLLGGHVLSALVGVLAHQVLGSHMWLAAAIAVSTAIALMHLTATLHPPGGATALIAVIGSQRIHDLGYFFAAVPVGLGALLLLVVAVLVNNIPKHRRYPRSWF
jgi:CBS-domain-containing membrane protein